MRSKIIGSLVTVFAFAAVLAVFAIPVMPSPPARVRAPVTFSATTLSAPQERNVRGVVEMIDAPAQRIRLSGKDYVFSPAKVRVSDKTGKLPASALRVGDRTQCVMIDDGAKQYLTEVWVET